MVAEANTAGAECTSMQGIIGSNAFILTKERLLEVYKKKVGDW
jgi:hypothetical protein